MKNKHVGYLVLGLTLVFFFVVMSFNYALQSIVEVSCTHGTLCPMHATVQTQQIISYGLMGLLALVSLFIIFFMKDETIIQESKKEISEEEKHKKLENLDDEERKLIHSIGDDILASYVLTHYTGKLHQIHRLLHIPLDESYALSYGESRPIKPMELENAVEMEAWYDTRTIMMNFCKRRYQ